MVLTEKIHTGCTAQIAVQLARLRAGGMHSVSFRTVLIQLQSSGADFQSDVILVVTRIQHFSGIVKSDLRFRFVDFF